MLNMTKTSGKVIAKRVDRERYGSLLASAPPAVIQSEKENDYYLAVVEQLMMKGDDLSKEEEALLDLLALLIETFERRYYKIKKSTPLAVLNELIATTKPLCTGSA